MLEVLVQQEFNFCSFFWQKVYSKDVDYIKTLFFESFKIIKNMHTVGHWFCLCQYYSGCRSLEIFLRLKKEPAVSVNFRKTSGNVKFITKSGVMVYTLFSIK